MNESRPTLTSDDVLKNPYAISEYDEFNYVMTEGELGWLEFVRGKYSIADYLLSTLDENNVVEIELTELSQALDDDCGGAGKAVCLSDETALQHICFYGYIEPM